MRFHAESLEDIAKHFEAEAASLRESGNDPVVNAEAETWREAASILRMTELVSRKPRKPRNERRKPVAAAA